MEIIVTKRLTLRPPLDVDVDGLVAGLSNPKVARNLSSVPTPYGEADARQYLEKMRGKSDACLYTIHRVSLIGGIGVDERDGRYVLGYWLAEPFWGQGFATEAARAVLAHAFRHFGAGEIRSYAFAENAASLNVMEKLGFQRTGTRDQHCLARGTDVPSIETRLSREAFERRFGSLETGMAA